MQHESSSDFGLEFGGSNGFDDVGN